MAENKSSVSKKRSYRKIGEFWDEHDLSEGEAPTGDVNFSVELQSDIHYVAIDDSLSKKIRSAATRLGITSESLVNLWLQERINQELPKN